MNVLNNNSVMKNYNRQNNSPNITEGIRRAKQLMQLSNSNPYTILQQNPQVQQILQMYKGKNLKDVYYSMCQRQGIDPNVILNELRN